MPLGGAGFAGKMSSSSFNAKRRLSAPPDASGTAHLHKMSNASLTDTSGTDIPSSASSSLVESNDPRIDEVNHTSWVVLSPFHSFIRHN